MLFYVFEFFAFLVKWQISGIYLSTSDLSFANLTAKSDKRQSLFIFKYKGLSLQIIKNNYFWRHSQSILWIFLKTSSCVCNSSICFSLWASWSFSIFSALVSYGIASLSPSSIRKLCSTACEMRQRMINWNDYCLK